MEIEVRDRNGVVFIEALGRITQVNDALELVSAGVQHGTDGVLIEVGALPDAFFDLSSGFAGEFVQKLQNYRLRLAAVLPADGNYSDRFREFLQETRRGRTFRVFAERTAAEEWLTAG